MKDANPQHNAVFQIQQNLLLLSIVADQRMKCVAVGHPADQSRVGGQRNHRVPLNSTCTLSHYNRLVIITKITIMIMQLTTKKF